MAIDPVLLDLGTKLAETSAKNTWVKVSDKLRQIKANNDKDAQILEYEDLVRSLVREKSELEDIASGYKEQIEKITISDDDIESLHNTVEKIITIILSSSFMSSENEDDKSSTADSLYSLLQLLNSDTLKTLQLLGYNYKEAIGIPLTEATANFISGKLKNNRSKSKLRH